MARYALVIGIAKYKNFRNLPKSVADAEAVAQLLDQQCYKVTRLPRKLITENQWTIDIDKEVTEKDIAEELQIFLKQRAANQEAIVYFAGHGFKFTNSMGRQKGYLATSNSTKDGQNAIAFDDLNGLIAESNLSSLVMLLDCCYAGSFVEEGKRLLKENFSQSHIQNYCFMAACRDFERAREGEKHGIFTDAVLKGLSPQNVDQNGIITSAKLLDFVSTQLTNSGQEVAQTSAHDGHITLVEYANYQQSQHLLKADKNPLGKALELLRPSFEVLDKKFFETTRRGRSNIIHSPAATWSLILQDNYIERDQQGEAFATAKKLAEFSGISLLLIRGEPAAGKTTLLRWLAYELFRQGHRVFHKKLECDLGWLEQLHEFSQQAGEQHFYIITDDLFRDDNISDELKEFEFVFPFTLIGTTILNEDKHRSLKNRGYKIECLDLNRPSELEKQRVLEKVSQDETVKAKVQKMSATKRQELMDSPTMLVLMSQLQEGEVFQETIAKRINSLANTKEYPIYEIFGVFCSFFQHGISVPQEILRLCLPEFEYSHKLIQKRLEGLIDTAIYAGFEGFTTIHELIAKTAMEIEDTQHLGSDKRAYSSFDSPPLLEKYLIKIIQNVDATSLTQERWVYHGLRLLVVRGEVTLVRKVLNNYPQQIQALQEKSTITSLLIWVKVYQALGLPDQKNLCIDAIFQTEPKNGWEWLHWISHINRFGTQEQKQNAIAKISIWLESHSDDWHVRPQYLTLIERLGSSEQKQDAIVEISIWLKSHPDDWHVRTKYLGLIGKHGTPEKKQSAIAEISIWLESHPDNSYVRTKYLELIDNYGTPEQKQDAIAEISIWLESHPDNTDVRTKYLGLIGNYGTPEQKQDAIAEISIWLKCHPDITDVRTKYLGLIENHGTPEQKQDAIAEISIWLKSHPDDSSVRTKYLVFVGKVSQEAEDIQAIIKEQWQWFKQKQRVNQTLWTTFISLLFYVPQTNLIQEVIDSALQQHPDNIYIIVTIFGYFRDYLDYKTCYQLANKIEQSRLPIEKWQNYIHAANIFRDYGELNIAEKMYNKTINAARWHIRYQNATDLETIIDFASLNYARLLLVKEQPHWYKAIGLLNPILRRNDDYAAAHWLMALCNRAKGENFDRKTIDSYNKALHFDKEKNGFFWCEFGDFYWYELKNIHEARKCFNQSIIQKKNLRACVILAELEVEAGNFSRAKTALEQGLSLIPITRLEKEEREKLNELIQTLQKRLGL